MSLYRVFQDVRRGDRFLFVVGLVLLAALGPMLAAIALDDRVITGAPAWLKPAKFAASTAIYSFTLAWTFGFIPKWRRTRWIASRITGVVFLVEVGIIAAQAWRGTTSHFNVATALDATLFAIMGAGIALQTLAAAAVALALWRATIADRALGWALRLGVTVAIVGASLGGLMTRPTPSQLADAGAGRPPQVQGAHTIGAPDGGPGLPATGWSLEHGDLRVAHFLGLHAMQALPLAALLLRRRVRDEPRRTRLVFVATGSYATLFAMLAWQALRGQSVVAPDALTAAALAAWALVTASAAALAVRQSLPRRSSTGRPEAVSA